MFKNDPCSFDHSEGRTSNLVTGLGVLLLLLANLSETISHRSIVCRTVHQAQCLLVFASHALAGTQDKTWRAKKVVKEFEGLFDSRDMKNHIGSMTDCGCGVLF